MKKFLVFVSLIGATQTVFAAVPEQPWLLTPTSANPLPLATPISFSWANTKPAAKYRLIVSSTSNFSGYNSKTHSCVKTCFTTTLSKLTYDLADTNALLKPDNNYYWRVEALNAAGLSSLSDIRAFAFGTPITPIDAKFLLAAIPVVTDVPPSPSSVVQGTPITFAATLDIPLPTGYNVKIYYGNGLITMKDTGAAVAGTSFNYVATPSVKSSLYTIGIYDSKNVLKSNKVTGNFEVTPAIPPNVPPTLSIVSGGLTTANVDADYTVTLSATDANSDLRLISMDWGDSTGDSLNLAEGESVIFSHSYNPAGSYTWTANAYDYSDAVSLVSATKTVVVNVPAAPVTTSATTTTTTNKTGCSADKNGLMWEVKTNDSLLHDKDWTYSWYEPDASKNGGYAGVEHGGTCHGTSKCNTYDYINTVNAEGLCGLTNWRLPTKAELESLVLCSDKKSRAFSANEKGDICTGSPTSPTIDTVKFPNTKSDWFWTSSTVNLPVVIAKAVATTTTGTAATTTATGATGTTGTSTTTAGTTTATTGTTTGTTTATTSTGTTTPVTPVAIAPTKPTTGTVSSTTAKLDAISAWTVVFFNGYNAPANKGNAVGVRLVSGGAAATATATVKK